VIKCDYANIPVFLCNTRIFVRFLLDSLSEIVYINHNKQMFNYGRTGNYQKEGRMQTTCSVEFAL